MIIIFLILAMKVELVNKDEFDFYFQKLVLVLKI